MVEPLRIVETPPLDADGHGPPEPDVTYAIKVAIYTPKGRLLGCLEKPWDGPHAIGELCNTLVSINSWRNDLDQCHIDVRWRKLPRPAA